MVGVGVSWLLAAADDAEGLVAAIKSVVDRGGAARGVRLLRIRRGIPVLPRPRQASRGLLDIGARDKERHGFSFSIWMASPFPTFARQRVSGQQEPCWNVL